MIQDSIQGFFDELPLLLPGFLVTAIFWPDIFFHWLTAFGILVAFGAVVFGVEKLRTSLRARAAGCGVLAILATMGAAAVRHRGSGTECAPFTVIGCVVIVACTAIAIAGYCGWRRLNSKAADIERECKRQAEIAAILQRKVQKPDP